MGMVIEKSFTVRAPRQAVWNFLTDPERVARCLPGAAITGPIGDPGERKWGGTIIVKAGPVTANYKGTLRFERLDEAAGEAELTGSGQETKGKGGADMKMKSTVVERSASETEVVVVSDVNVVGVLAQFGRGMIQDIGDQLFEKFTAGVRRELEADAADAVQATHRAGSSPTPPGNLSAPTASSPPTHSARSTPAAPSGTDALDVGALGAAAAGRALTRTLQRPGFWICVVACAVALYWFLR